jgi:hypothetical protein
VICIRSASDWNTFMFSEQFVSRDLKSLLGCTWVPIWVQSS